MEEALKKDGSWDAYADIDLPLVGVLAVMERVGAAIDVERLEALGREAQAEVDGLTAPDLRAGRGALQLEFPPSSWPTSSSRYWNCPR